MGKIAKIEYFRVPPRWLFVKITDEAGNHGWGEASLEGHSQAVEGCLDAWTDRYLGFEAEYETSFCSLFVTVDNTPVRSSTYGRCAGEPASTAVDLSS
jgi:L-alanine-DL-glutamate epimerase-like enolase superfamily enzyme